MGSKAFTCWALALASLLAIARSMGSFGSCGANTGAVEFDDMSLSPQDPHGGEEVTLKVQLMIPRHAEEPLDTATVKVVGYIEFCRRFQDCMPLRSHTSTACHLMGKAADECPVLQPGERASADARWTIPDGVVRGTYSMMVSMFVGDKEIGCYSLANIEVVAHRWTEELRDYRDAIVAFGIAASSSACIGKYFPIVSRGLLPQITGFLMIGILVGPYVTNLVSHMHIFLMGDMINRVSLAFIGGAAGAEIFLPEFREILGPMAIQVGCITVMTMLLVTGGLLFFTGLGALYVPALEIQESYGAKVAVALLAGSMMTARSPASAIAVIAELRCNEFQCAKMAIGATVLSDVVVLVLFSLCSSVVRISISGGSLDASVLLGASIEIGVSLLVGVVAGQILRMTLPRHEWEKGHEALGDSVESSGEPSYLVGARGALVIAILCLTFQACQKAPEWTHEALRLEPLLACTMASCFCGHDEGVRPKLLESLSFWTPHVLLPFFTLAGASLELPGLAKVLPAAITLVILRCVANAVGSSVAGLLIQRLSTKARVSAVTMSCTWLTLLAQAGVTLGLVLEVQAQKAFQRWSRHYAVLVLGVVMLNQLIGPVACRVGLNALIKDEEQYKLQRGDEHEDEDGSEGSSSSMMSTDRLKGAQIIPPYDTLERASATENHSNSGSWRRSADKQKA